MLVNSSAPMVALILGLDHGSEWGRLRNFGETAMHMCREMTGQEAGQRGDQQFFAANMILLQHDGMLRGKVLHHSPCKKNDSLVRRNKAERSRRPREADFEDRTQVENVDRQAGNAILYQQSSGESAS